MPLYVYTSKLILKVYIEIIVCTSTNKWASHVPCDGNFSCRHTVCASRSSHAFPQTVFQLPSMQTSTLPSPSVLLLASLTSPCLQDTWLKSARPYIEVFHYKIQWLVSIWANLSKLHYSRYDSVLFIVFASFTRPYNYVFRPVAPLTSPPVELINGTVRLINRTMVVAGCIGHPDCLVN